MHSAGSIARSEHRLEVNLNRPNVHTNAVVVVARQLRSQLQQLVTDSFHALLVKWLAASCQLSVLEVLDVQTPSTVKARD